MTKGGELPAADEWSYTAHVPGFKRLGSESAGIPPGERETLADGPHPWESEAIHGTRPSRGEARSARKSVEPARLTAGVIRTTPRPRMFSSEATTRGIHVVVHSRYIPERSEPGVGWFFAYTVSIANRGTEKAQLVSRRWLITDANGQVEEVDGPGVVGEQPVLAPGESFEYTSACPLPTPFGTMQGCYRMLTDEGETFDAEIAPFTLAEPHAVN